MKVVHFRGDRAAASWHRNLRPFATLRENVFSFGRGGAGRPRSPPRPRVPVQALGRPGDRPLLHRRCATGASRASAPPTAACSCRRPSTTPRPARRCDELVEVGPAGVVTTWAWVTAPRAKQPLDRPFAWALIKLDGADTAMLHAVDAGDEAAMRDRHARDARAGAPSASGDPRHRVLRAGGERWPSDDDRPAEPSR